MAQLTEEEQEEMQTMAADNEVSRLDWPLARILPSDTRPLVVAGVWQYPAGNTSDHRGEGLGGKGADALSTRAQAERRATQQRGEEGGRHHEVAEDGGIVQVRTVAAGLQPSPNHEIAGALGNEEIECASRAIVGFAHAQSYGS